VAVEAPQPGREAWGGGRAMPNSSPPPKRGPPLAAGHNPRPGSRGPVRGQRRGAPQHEKRSSCVSRTGSQGSGWCGAGRAVRARRCVAG